MNIHEYQAKELLRNQGVPVLKGRVATTVDEAVDVARALGGEAWCVKAQIHAGGRGKGGGIKLAHSLHEVHQCAREILGIMLKTSQTKPEGQLVRQVYIEQGAHIDRQLYFALLIDRETRSIVAMTSKEGGMDIEDVARCNPQAIQKTLIHPLLGLQAYQARRMAFDLGFTGSSIKSALTFFEAAYQTFVEYDMSLLEVNPLIVTRENQLFALDAKMSFDDNALFRQPIIAALQDQTEENPIELEAQRQDLSYIQLNGNIGCLVNGAGLAMATMDIIQYYGAEPANFLDLGGRATRERVTAAFKIILSDRRVKSILVNIFGGIMRCDIVAEGIIAAVKDLGELAVPLVVRLEGTNVERGRQILAHSGLNIQIASHLDEAAQLSVKAMREAIEWLF